MELRVMQMGTQLHWMDLDEGMVSVSQRRFRLHESSKQRRACQTLKTWYDQAETVYRLVGKGSSSEPLLLAPRYGGLRHGEADVRLTE